MISQKELKELVHYNPDTGIFTWKLRIVKSRGDSIFNSRFAGKPVGSVTVNGRYYETSIRGKKYLLHRLAWFYTYGTWPDEVDHEDHDGLNNRLDNLREVAHDTNMKNMKKHISNKSGVNGVYWHKQNKKWAVQIWNNNKAKHVGCYLNFDEAVEARRIAEVEHGYHENHGKG